MNKVENNITCGELNSKFINEREFAVPFLSNSIVIVGCHFYLSNYNKYLYRYLNIHFPDTIKKSVIKRQAEYLAGRYVATAALLNLGLTVASIDIGKHRSPVWPDQISASISHNGTTAICAAANKLNYEFLGIDIENRISSELVSVIKSNVINNKEENLLVKHAICFEDAFTIVFSAKESLFKALYPSVGYYFGFLDAVVTSICSNTNSFNIMLNVDLTPELRAKTKFKGYFWQDGSEIITVIAQ